MHGKAWISTFIHKINILDQLTPNDRVMFQIPKTLLMYATMVPVKR